MDSAKVGFWIKLGLVIMTMYMMTLYLFTPIKNQCKMTFMMEPPRFIPVPIDPSSRIYRSIQAKQSQNYKLFMYSEFGFPMEDDLRRDVKDSMPVLFIPGNAGSYQQVRSLASTCIRRQLQSLDAYKFIFYTIDFQAQLSAISGDLIENQIDFVHSALKEISRIHPEDTQGVIVIGHSVGGFLSKAVFTRPDFDSDLVPLLINLASPLTKPYLNFDAEMQRIYQKANDHWSNNNMNLNTVSISISGGRADRLVPMYSSLDSSYDLALTTSSIRDVWLTTDHVCITWCRELMHKLSTTLSRVMHKKGTSLIADKRLVIKRISEQLLTPVRAINKATLEIDKKIDLKMIKPKNFVDFKGAHSLNRQELMDETFAFDMIDSKGDLLIWIEHIDKLRLTSIYGCSELEHQNDSAHAICTSRINLLEFAITIPSRNYETKKEAILVKLNSMPQYLFVDFSTAKYREDKIPENIHMQSLEESESINIYIPTMTEFFMSRIFGTTQLIDGDIAPWIKISESKPTMFYSKYELDNLRHESQYYIAKLESKNCKSSSPTKSSDGDLPREATVLITQDGYVQDAFRPDRGNSTVIVKFNSLKSIFIRDELAREEEENSLIRREMHLFLDGTCAYSLRLEFDWMAFIEMTIQRHLSKIFMLSGYFSYASTVWHSFRLGKYYLEYEQSSTAISNMFSGLIWFCWLLNGTFMYSYVEQRQNPNFLREDNSMIPTTDQVLQFVFVFIIANGLKSSIEYSINRLVDLATIINKVQFTVGDKINQIKATAGDLNISKQTNGNNNRINGSNHTDAPSTIRHRGVFVTPYRWLLLSLAAICGSLFSEAIISVYILLILIKLELNLALDATKQSSIASQKSGKSNLRVIDEGRPEIVDQVSEATKLSVIQDLFISVSSLCLLSLLANIPVALLTFDNNGALLESLRVSFSTGRETSLHFILILMSAVMIHYCEIRIDQILSKPECDVNDQRKRTHTALAGPNERFQWLGSLGCLANCAHLVALAPIICVDENLRHLNWVNLITLVWLVCMLTKCKSKRSLMPNEAGQKLKTD